MTSPEGELVNRAFILKSACELGLHLTLRDVKADEFSILAVIRQETAEREYEIQQELARSNQHSGQRSR